MKWPWIAAIVVALCQAARPAISDPADAALVLENEALKALISPAKGGALVSLVLKGPDRELAGGPTVTESLLLPGGARVALRSLAFEVVGRPTAARCVLRARLPDNPQRNARTHPYTRYPYYPDEDFTGVVLEKSYHLPRGTHGLRVEYAFTNTGRKPVVLCPAYERDFLSGVRGRQVIVSGRERPIMLGGDDPLVRAYFRSRSRTMETGADAWVAYASGRDVRLLNVFPPECVGAIRWAPLQRRGRARCEFVGMRIVLKPGEVVRVSSWIQPFQGDPTEVAGAEGGIIGRIALSPPVDLTAAEVVEGRFEDVTRFVDVEEIDLGPTPGGVAPATPASKKGYRKGSKVLVRITLTSALARKATLTAYAARLPTGVPQRLGAKAVRLEAGAPQEVRLGFVPKDVGTWRVDIEVTEGDRRLCVLRRAVEVQGPSGFMLTSPPPGRRGEVFREWGRFDPFSIHRKPGLEVQVPHVEYARPYHRGKVRAALVVPWQLGREAVEILQRMDLEADVVYTGGHGFIWEQRLVHGKLRRAPIDEVNALKEALNGAPQVIMLIGTPASWFGEDVVAEIVRQVRTGTGLVLAPMQGFPDFFAALEKDAQERPIWPGEGSRVAHLGKGRLCFVPAPGSHRSYRPQVATSELRLEQFCRAVLWAARMEPRVRLDVRPRRLAFDNLGPAKSVTVLLHNDSGDALNGTLELIARQERARDFPSVYGRAYSVGVLLSMPYCLLEDVYTARREIALAAGAERRVTLNLPPLRAGTYRVFVVLRDGEDRVVNWTHVPTRVTTPVRVRRAEITKLPADDRRLFGFREEDRFRLDLEFQATGDLPADLTAFLAGEDKTGRVLFRRRVPVKFDAKRAKVRFESGLAGAHYRLLILRFGLEAAGRPLLEERRPLLMRESAGRRPKFRFVLLDNESNLPLHLTGMSEQMGPYSAVTFAWYEMTCWPVGEFLKVARWVEDARDAAAREVGKKAERLMKALGEGDKLARLGQRRPSAPREAEKPFVRLPCFNNPRFRQNRIEAIRRFASARGILGPQYVYFTHEYGYGSPDACQCRYCQAAFRKHLKEMYGSLAALNREWGTHYDTWDDVRLHRIGKDLTPPPMRDWPRVIDTQRYKSTQLMDLAFAVRRAGEDISDDIRWGHIALSKMGLWVGMDFWEWSRIGRKHIMYRDVDEWRSMAGLDSTTGWHSGYGRQYNPSESQYKLWAALLAGRWGIAHFTCPGYPLARPDGTFFEGPKALVDTLHEIHRGWGDLLLGHDLKDGVGIYRSSHSFFVHMMEYWQARGKKPGNGAMDWPRRIAHFLVGAAAGHQQAAAHYLWHGQAEKGSLGLFGKPRIIFLCYTTAMSEAEARTLRAFVREGGTLVGGVNVATRDIHGRPYEKPLLDDLFGIEHVGGYAPAVGVTGDKVPPTPVRFDEPVAGVTVMRPLVVGPANVRLRPGSKALARYELDGRRCPAYIMNTAGRGRTVYLNFLLLHMNQNNGQNWDAATSAASRALVQHLVKEAGVKPFSRIEYEEDTSLTGRVTRFRDGRNEYLTFLAPYGYAPRVYAGLKARLRLLAPRHVYDARRGRYLGEGDTFPVTVSADKLAGVYALLPYRVTGLQIGPRRATVAAGEVAEFDVKVRTVGGPPGRHVIRVEAAGPDGRLRNVHGYNLVAPAGEAVARVHLALNAPPGRWELRCTDRATGIAARTSFTVAADDGMK